MLRMLSRSSDVCHQRSAGAATTAAIWLGDASLAARRSVADNGSHCFSAGRWVLMLGGAAILGRCGISRLANTTHQGLVTSYFSVDGRGGSGHNNTLKRFQERDEPVIGWNAVMAASGTPDRERYAANLPRRA